MLSRSHYSCATWALNGFCTSNFYSVTLRRQYCAKTCNLSIRMREKLLLYSRTDELARKSIIRLRNSSYCCRANARCYNSLFTNKLTFRRISPSSEPGKVKLKAIYSARRLHNQTKKL
ncbi:unnamed protein product [Angiostrongylus costaricensis]|uniref:ShKT domain-containing protein n=1 Tax=Angiostrongylus costaricensis TaxID=334426 RepID=A0A0R3PD95_ANGCS|nr:unnamed protein product [Angiostrongylus costaricensis]